MSHAPNAISTPWLRCARPATLPSLPAPDPKPSPAPRADGLRTRNALEANDGTEVRIDKIIRIIDECRWGVPDISRVQLTRQGLPGFNCPFELGLFLGAHRFGYPDQRRTPRRTGTPRPARLAHHAAGRPCGEARSPSIQARLGAFHGDLRAICQRIHCKEHELTFFAYDEMAYVWVQADLARAAAS